MWQGTLKPGFPLPLPPALPGPIASGRGACDRAPWHAPSARPLNWNSPFEGPGRRSRHGPGGRGSRQLQHSCRRLQGAQARSCPARYLAGIDITVARRALRRGTAHARRARALLARSTNRNLELRRRPVTCDMTRPKAAARISRPEAARHGRAAITYRDDTSLMEINTWRITVHVAGCAAGTPTQRPIPHCARWHAPGRRMHCICGAGRCAYANTELSDCTHARLALGYATSRTRT